MTQKPPDIDSYVQTIPENRRDSRNTLRTWMHETLPRPTGAI